MDNDSRSQNPAQKSAQKYFTKSGQDEAAAKEIRKKERNATAAKTAKLRALRLAKEATDKLEADKLAAETPPTAAPKVRRRASAKPNKLLRISY